MLSCGAARHSLAQTLTRTVPVYAEWTRTIPAGNDTSDDPARTSLERRGAHHGATRHLAHYDLRHASPEPGGLWADGPRHDSPGIFRVDQRTGRDPRDHPAPTG